MNSPALRVSKGKSLQRNSFGASGPGLEVGARLQTKGCSLETKHVDCHTPLGEPGELTAAVKEVSKRPLSFGLRFVFTLSSNVPHVSPSCPKIEICFTEFLS